MVKWWITLSLMLQMQLIGMMGVGQQCLIPAEVLITQTKSNGQIFQAKAEGGLTITAISRDRGLESLMTILALVVHPIRLGTW